MDGCVFWINQRKEQTQYQKNPHQDVSSHCFTASTTSDIDGLQSPALLNELLHLYSVSSGIRLTFRHVVRESGPQSVNNTSVELRVSQRRNGNHLHILIREITGITVTDNTGKDFRHDTSKRKHVHLIVRLRST